MRSNKRPVRVYRPLLIASWLDLLNARLAIVSVCVCMCFGRQIKFQSIHFCHSNPSICLLIEMIELGKFTAVLKPNKRPVKVFLCLQAACIEGLGVGWL